MAELSKKGYRVADIYKRIEGSVEPIYLGSNTDGSDESLPVLLRILFSIHNLYSIDPKADIAFGPGEGSPPGLVSLLEAVCENNEVHEAGTVTFDIPTTKLGCLTYDIPLDLAQKIKALLDEAKFIARPTLKLHQFTCANFIEKKCLIPVRPRGGGITWATASDAQGKPEQMTCSQVEEAEPSKCQDSTVVKTDSTGGEYQQAPSAEVLE